MHTYADGVLIHRDIKSNNLLVNKSMNVKIGDFGFSKLKQNARTMTSCGTAAYAAPEILRAQRYDESIDIYSFGIVLWEIFTTEKLHQGVPPIKLPKLVLPILNRNNFMQVIEGLRPNIPASCPLPYAGLMKSCWNDDPSQRPKIKFVVETLEECIAQL